MTQNLPKLTKLYTNKAGRILLYENYALTTGKFSFEVCKFTLTHLKYCRQASFTNMLNIPTGFQITYLIVFTPTEKC